MKRKALIAATAATTLVLAAGLACAADLPVTIDAKLIGG